MTTNSIPRTNRRYGLIIPLSILIPIRSESPSVRIFPECICWWWFSIKIKQCLTLINWNSLSEILIFCHLTKLIVSIKSWLKSRWNKSESDCSTRFLNSSNSIKSINVGIFICLIIIKGWSLENYIYNRTISRCKSRYRNF